jgi:hypothetical protein
LYPKGVGAAARPVQQADHRPSPLRRPQLEPIPLTKLDLHPFHVLVGVLDLDHRAPPGPILRVRLPAANGVHDRGKLRAGTDAVHAPPRRGRGTSLVLAAPDVGAESVVVADVDALLRSVLVGEHDPPEDRID